MAVSKQGGFADFLFRKLMPKIYGIGGGIVIIGAMFKLLHFPGAGLMLILGLSTEALIFFLSAFEPVHGELDWTKVYPELGDAVDGPSKQKTRKKEPPPKKEILTPTPQAPPQSFHESANAMQNLGENVLTKDVVESLGKGMRNLVETTKNLSNVNSMAFSTTEYTDKLRNASENIDKMTNAYTTSMQGVINTLSVSNSVSENLASASSNARNYQNQLNAVSKNLEALNAVYEMELQDANNHLELMNKLYSNLSRSLEDMSYASREAEQFKQQIGQLTSNLAKLNGIYGSMISVLKSS